jgi:hypothetical protein
MSATTTIPSKEQNARSFCALRVEQQDAIVQIQVHHCHTLQQREDGMDTQCHRIVLSSNRKLDHPGSD